jgi:hypothetical protein
MDPLPLREVWPQHLSALDARLREMDRSDVAEQLSAVAIPAQAIPGSPVEFSFMAYPIPRLTYEQRLATRFRPEETIVVAIASGSVGLILDHFGWIEWFEVCSLPELHAALMAFNTRFSRSVDLRNPHRSSTPLNVRQHSTFSDADWRAFFGVCARVLGHGDWFAARSDSWCSWTTFRRLAEDGHYWEAGLPNESELCDTYIADGGAWGQPFLYHELAHVLVPRTFNWESGTGADHRAGIKQQDIDRISSELRSDGIPHRITERLLEVKLFLGATRVA